MAKDGDQDGPCSAGLPRDLGTPPPQVITKRGGKGLYWIGLSKAQPLSKQHLATINTPDVEIREMLCNSDVDANPFFGTFHLWFWENTSKVLHLAWQPVTESPPPIIPPHLLPSLFRARGFLSPKPAWVQISSRGSNIPPPFLLGLLLLSNPTPFTAGITLVFYFQSPFVFFFSPSLFSTLLSLGMAIVGNSFVTCIGMCVFRDMRLSWMSKTNWVGVGSPRFPSLFLPWWSINMERPPVSCIG